MVKALVDDDGKFMYSLEDEVEAADPALYDQTKVVDLPPKTLVDPKWDGTAWTEEADAPTVAADLTDYQDKAKAAVTHICEAKFIEVHGSLQVAAEHAAKWREANAVDAAATKNPKAERDGAGMSNSPYIDEYVAEFGGTNQAAADAILAAEWTDALKGAKIARYRKRAVTDIDAAVDRAGVDTALTNLTTNLATI